VLLAAGGFPRDMPRRAAVYPGPPQSGPLQSPTPVANTGDGIAMGEAVGGRFEPDLSNAAPWVPISVIPGRTGPEAAFPHLTDRTKPGFIAVTRAGRRFVNEANSYHDFVQALRAACPSGDAEAFILCDSRAIGRYGLGFAKPFPVPHRHHVTSGYLLRADTLEGLATKAGIDPAALAATVERYNQGAREGVDPDFGKGSTAYNRYQGDARHGPNPCLAPIEAAPYYAVRVIPGEIGTFAGLRIDGCARVLDAQGRPIAGLYAAGNDTASVMGGAYPGAGTTLGPAMTWGYVAARHAAGRLDGPQEGERP
jgi:succinate dehydrogenase/fumarate reductase flavoprotein subunit